VRICCIGLGVPEDEVGDSMIIPELDTDDFSQWPDVLEVWTYSLAF
jgi:hypothetical protein